MGSCCAKLLLGACGEIRKRLDTPTALRSASDRRHERPFINAEGAAVEDHRGCAVEAHGRSREERSCRPSARLRWTRNSSSRDIKMIDGGKRAFSWPCPAASSPTTGPKCRSRNHLRAKFCNECGAAEGAARREGRRRPGQALRRHRPPHQFRLPGDDPAAGDPGLRRGEGPLASCPATCRATRILTTTRRGRRRTASPPGEPPKLQAAERPRGPHRPPTAPQRGPAPGETRVSDSFGAGIFE